jgi:hypothetical protein
MSAADKRTTIVDPHDDATVATDLHLSAEWQRAMGGGKRRAVHVLAVRSGSAAVSVRSTVNTCHFSIPAIGVETCQDTNNKEQGMSLRFAERSDHNDLTTRGAKIRFRSINVEVSPKRQCFALTLRLARLIALQQPRYPCDRPCELPSVILPDAVRNHPPLWLILEIDVRERLPLAILYDEGRI